MELERSTHLINVKSLDIRFSEVDSLGIVWHGHYIKYFEDGREAFGREHGLGYLDIYKKGFVIPIVKIECNYKRSLAYGERFIIETRYVDTDASKLIFSYLIKKEETKELVAEGKSVQVFLNEKKELCLITPDFFMDWKKGVGLL